MNTIIDCITSLKDLAVLALMWGGASGLVWIHDIAKARRKENDPNPATGTNTSKSDDT